MGKPTTTTRNITLKPFTYLFNVWKINRNLSAIDVEKDPKLKNALFTLGNNKRLMTMAVSYIVLYGVAASSAVTIGKYAKNSYDTTNRRAEYVDDLKKKHDSGEIKDYYSKLAMGTAIFDLISKVELRQFSKAIKLNIIILCVTSIIQTIIHFATVKYIKEAVKAVKVIESAVKDVEKQVNKIKDPNEKAEAEKRLTAIKVSLAKI